jgi:predicted RNA-binding protein with PIN domain
MRWLVDGYNVIRRDPDLRSREAERLADGRTALLQLVAGAALRSGDDFTVVFDGARAGGGEPSGGQVQVVFSRPPQNADQVLVRRATELRDAAIVVSSDRAVRDGARRVGAAVVTAEEFLAAVAAEAPDEAAEKEDEDEEDEPPVSKRGNPHRKSRQARATQRALERLRRPR